MAAGAAGAVDNNPQVTTISLHISTESPKQETVNI